MMRALWNRLTRETMHAEAVPEWNRIAGPGWKSQILTRSVTDRFHAKQGRSTGRLLLHRGQDRIAVYLKRHYLLPRFSGLMAALFPCGRWSPAMQEQGHLTWARANGFSVPEPMAWGERVGPWGKLQSFLAVAELTGMIPLHEAIPLAASRLGAVQFQSWKRGLTIELSKIVKRLHATRHYHKDLYLCHFYIPAALTGRLVSSWSGEVFMIDLHRLGHHPWTRWIWQIKDLAQLLYSSDVEGVEPIDRMRFWHGYRSSEKETMAERMMRFLIVWKWRRYRRHNVKRRAQEARRVPA